MWFQFSVLLLCFGFSSAAVFSWQRQRSPPELIARSYEEGKSICLTADPSTVFADEENCAGFYNCSKMDDLRNLPRFREECPYPGLFDRYNKRCEMNYKIIEPQCGSRKIKPSPCDQLHKQCAHAHCAPCWYRIPSCVGKPDGLQEWKIDLEIERSGWYADCKDGRTIDSGLCQKSLFGPERVFSTTQHKCVDVDSLW